MKFGMGENHGGEHVLTKVIAALGNSSCLPLDQTILKQLGADRGSVMKISFEGSKMIVQTMSKDEQEQMIADSGKKLSKKFARALKKLAE